jgi:hypothetical protein
MDYPDADTAFAGQLPIRPIVVLPAFSYLGDSEPANMVGNKVLAQAPRNLLNRPVDPV